MELRIRTDIVLLGLVAGVLLTSCGGGGGGGDPAPVTGDPLYGDQWHLKNTGQVGGTADEDVNIEPVWSSGRRGEGIRIVVVDDGLEIAHEDLAANVLPGASYNYVMGNTDPTGGDHGTSCAGVAASRDDNGLGGRGAAPRAALVGYNLLAALNATNEADAMTRDAANNSVSSNSWGAPDRQGTLDAPGTTWASAIDTGLTTGRNGRGLIYLWAAGNGAPIDNSNYDGQANYHGVMAIAALNDKGKKASYSELGANLWVSAYGGEFCDTHTITTTDRTGFIGSNTNTTPNDYTNKNYTKCFNGTSSATPLTAGVVATVLQAKPDLGWRDLRQVLALSARQNDPTDTDWQTNAAGKKVNHKYGFGVIDANAAVNLAGAWSNIGPSLVLEQTLADGRAIPDGSGISSPTFGTQISSDIIVSGSTINKIEFVEVILTSNHTYSGDLEVVLSKAGSVDSRFAEAHICPNGPCGAGYASGWRFGSARYLNETANGTWTLKVRDGYTDDFGNLTSWTLRIHGRAN